MHDTTKATAKRHANKLEKKEKVLKKILDYPQGFSVKEVSIDAGLTPECVRKYINEFLESGEIQDTGHTEGRTCIYIHSDFVTDKKEEEYKQNVAAQEEPPKVCAGKEFKEPRRVTSVVAGDISWISSRSGNGMFFRYLILIVHSYKATCVNVFPEGHEAVNINDPNFIFVGTDPETDENLYADLTNVCQRRFSAFGERCVHISPEHMENVKNRMARLLKVDIHPVGDQGTVEKLRKENNKLCQALETASKDYQKLSLDYAAYREGVNNQFKGIVHEKKEADKARDELQARLDKLLELYEQSRKAYFELEEKYNALQADKVPEDQPAEELETEDLDCNTDLYIAIATLRAQNELLERQLGEYLAIIDRLLPVNKEV